MTVADVLLDFYIRPRDGDKEFPAELVVIMGDDRKLVRPIHKDRAIPLLKDLLAFMFPGPALNEPLSVPVVDDVNLNGG